MTLLLFSFILIPNPLYMTFRSCSLSLLLSTFRLLKIPRILKFHNDELGHRPPFVFFCGGVGRVATGWICSIQKSMSWFLGNLHCRTISQILDLLENCYVLIHIHYSFLFCFILLFELCFFQVSIFLPIWLLIYHVRDSLLISSILAF